MKNFQFKTWHFILLFLIMFVLSNILGHLDIKTTPNTVNESCFVEIDDATFAEASSSGINYILLYKENSDLCNKMEYNLNQLAKAKGQDINFYKLNIDRSPGKYSKYEVAGVPNVLVFKDGNEMERIMGIVPVSNLEIIHNRVSK